MKGHPLLLVEFWDHVAGTDPTGAKLVKCTTVGFLHSQDKRQLVLCTWVCESVENNNNEYVVLHKNTIISKRRLK
jgi:hypothetical protein